MQIGGLETKTDSLGLVSSQIAARTHLAYAPAVMLSSFPMARLHTRPLTLGGRPCHHKSLTRRVAFLDGHKPHTPVQDTHRHRASSNTHGLIAVNKTNDMMNNNNGAFRVTRCFQSAFQVTPFEFSRHNIACELFLNLATDK